MNASENLIKSVSKVTGFSLDQVVFVVSIFLCVPFGLFYREVLHPSKVSASLRIGVGFLAGLVLNWLCFGWQVLIMVGITTVCYVLTIGTNPNIVHRCVFVVAMAILSAAHLYRQITDYGGYVLDYTGPLMLITQKVIYVAFSLHDGSAREEAELNAEQKKEQLRQTPTPLEYYGYIFHYSNTLIGPVCTYREYEDFISGTEIKGNQQSDPSPVRAVTEKMSIAVFCVVVFALFGHHYPIPVNADPVFIASSPFLYRLWYAWFSIMVTRMRYYFAFKAGEAINNACGIGFNGYDESGRPLWNKISNANVMKLEVPQNMKMLLDNWNISTALWLRRIVYDRVTTHRTLATFILSALWHGFYGGYYLTFVTCQVMVEAARAARRTLREHFQHSKSMSRVYDVITGVVTILFITYTTVPFVLLDPWKGLRFWSSMYYYGHFGSILALLLLKSKRSSSKSQDSSRHYSKNSDPNRNGLVSRDETCAELIQSPQKRS